MTHKLLSDDLVESSRKASKMKEALLSIGGKFGFSLFVGTKEVFIGISVSDVEIEKIIKRRIIPTTKSKVKVFNFESL